MANAYHHFDGMCWPLAGERSREIEWAIRHAPEMVTRNDLLAAASIISAYRQMIHDSERKRARVIRELRSAEGETE